MSKNVRELLKQLSTQLEDAVASGKENSLDRGDEPRGVSSLREGDDSLDIRGVLFQARVPVGRRGEVMPVYLLFPPVRDERELVDLAEEVQERFHEIVTTYAPRDRGEYRGNGYGRRGRGWR